MSWQLLRRIVLFLQAAVFLLVTYNRGTAQFPMGGPGGGLFSGNGLPGNGPIFPGAGPGNNQWGNPRGNPWNNVAGNPWNNPPGNNFNNVLGMADQQPPPGMGPTGRFFSNDLVTGSGVLSGPLPIVNRFGGIGGMRTGGGYPGLGRNGIGRGGFGMPGTGMGMGMGQNNNYNLLPPGVQLNLGFNTMPGMPTTMSQPMGGMPGFGRNGMNPYRMNPYSNPYQMNPYLNPYMTKGFGNGGNGL